MSLLVRGEWLLVARCNILLKGRWQRPLDLLTDKQEMMVGMCLLDGRKMVAGMGRGGRVCGLAGWVPP
jgi:hypothetical protein